MARVPIRRQNRPRSRAPSARRRACSSVCYHPATPSILAAGLFNGTIIVWDVSKTDSDPLVAQTAMGER